MNKSLNRVTCFLLIFCIALSPALPAYGQARSGGVANRVARFFISLPETEAEFANIFYRRLPNGLPERSPVRAEIEAMLAVKKRFVDLPNVEFIKQRERLSEALSKKESEIIVLVGHNESGNFRFPKGDPYSINELTDRGINNNKIVIVVSCQSSKYVSRSSIGIELSLAYDEAANITKELNKYFADQAFWAAGLNDPSSQREKEGAFLAGQTPLEYRITNIVNAALWNAKFLYTVKRFRKPLIIGGVLVAIGVIITITPDEPGGKSKPKR